MTTGRYTTGRWLAAALCALAVVPAGAQGSDAADRKLFEILDSTGNGYLTGTEITPEVRKYDLNSDGRISWEEFAAARARERGGKPAPAKSEAAAKPPAAATPKTQATAVPAAAAVPMAGPKLPALAPRPGYVIGRAFYGDGRPMPRFIVDALGWAGEVHLGPTGTLPHLGNTTGQNGQYALPTTSAYDRKKPVKAMVTVVKADALLSYNGREYRIAMHPTDGKPDGSGEGSFRGDSGKGVVRDFVLRISGPKRGYEKETPPEDTPTNERGDRSFAAFYGGTVALDFDTRGAGAEFSKLAGSTVTVTFTPSGALLDGSSARAIVRTMPIRQESLVGYTYYFRNLPLGDYTAAATLTKAGGASVPLRFRVAGALQGSAPVVFAPFNTISHVETVQLYLVP